MSDDPDVETVAIDPAEIARLTDGAILAEGVFGVCFSGAAVRSSRRKWARSFPIGFRPQELSWTPGARSSTSRPRPGVVSGIGTGRGTVECDAVVLAAGAWSNELLRPLDTYLPTVFPITSRIISEPPGVPAQVPALFLMGLAPEPGGTFL